MRLNKNYPSSLNSKFLNKKIDAGFMSSIAVMKSNRENKACDIGIIAKKDVWSVIILKGNNEDDSQSASSNALCKIMNLSGKVLIGDKALKFYYENFYKNFHSKNEEIFKDIANEWYKNTKLPFVFGRMCFNSYPNFYRLLEKRFIASLGNSTNFCSIKIPHTVIMEYSKKLNIDCNFAKKYLRKIYFKIGTKEKLSLSRFYYKVRIKKLSIRRNYNRPKTIIT